MFSATFANDVRELAATLLHDPAQIQVARRNAPIELVRQVVIPVDRQRKRDLLSWLVRSGRIDKALVFTRTKYGTQRLADQLVRDGINATAIHGDRTQGQRVKALDDFKDSKVDLLVATEVAARGLDIDGLPHVVNFELPTVPEDYIHRIGRTGRAGMEGDAISLVCLEELPLLDDIERLLQHAIAREFVPGFEPDSRVDPAILRAIEASRRGGAPRSGPNRPIGVRRRIGNGRPAAGRRREATA
jgi:ATP-dependent RNA helicase RhlE